MTPKQQKFIELISENLRNENVKTWEQIALEAGYSESMAKSVKQIFETEAVSEAMETLEEMFDKKLKLAVKHITPDKLEKSSARDAAYIADVMNKNKQLVSGGATERVTYSFGNYGDEESNHL